MQIIQETQLSHFSECSYIEDLEWRFEYFFAYELNYDDLDRLLAKGWRKFGIYYFRPNCVKCFKCIPLRVPVKDFTPSRSQRRVLRKAEKIRIEFKPLTYRDEIFEIYRDHSLNRFGREVDLETFISTFYTETCPAMQSEYYLDDELIGVGFLDISSQAFSSVYFIFKTRYEEFSPGTYSILKEIEKAESLGKKYYYLGYYIRENKSMSYKNMFLPNEKYNWEKERWELSLS
jgi:arginine-tRNA-protein transferase